MITTSIAVLTGSAIALYSSEAPDVFWFSLLPFTLAGCWVLPAHRFALITVSAFFLTGIHLHLIDQDNQAFQTRHLSIQIDGIIADIPRFNRDQIKFLFKPETSVPKLSHYPELIQLAWYRSKEKPKAGERWRLTVKLKPPGGFQNPDTFDYAQWLYAKKIGATGYVLSKGKNIKVDNANITSIQGWRQQISTRIDQVCPDCQNIGLLKALIIGYRGDIPHQVKLQLQDSNTAHLLAISGLHVGLISGLFYWVAGFNWRKWGYRVWPNKLEFAATAGLAAAIGYAALAGFSLPTQRALIMLIILYLSLILRNRLNLIDNLALAVTVILILSPTSLLSVSFWMSFLAVLVIGFSIFLLKPVKSRFKQLLLLQLLFTVLLLPVNILFFGQVGPASFLANIVAIPTISFIVLPGSILAMSCLLFNDGLANIVFQVIDLVLDGLIYFLGLLLDSGLSAIKLTAPPIMMLVLMVAGLVVLLLPIGLRRIYLSLSLMAPVIFWNPGKLQPGSFRVDVLDVGMGTSLVVRTENHSLVYDFGPGKATGYNSGSGIIRPFLNAQGIGQPDLFIISHVDQDHSGGFYAFQKEANPGALVTGTPVLVRKTFGLPNLPRSCHKMNGWVWDGIAFEFFSSNQLSQRSSTNDRSCVLKISGSHRVLITGDIESNQEAALIQRYGSQLKADILLAPHHGSLTSSSVDFIDAVGPKHTVFNAGLYNRWNFPKPEIMKRYQNVGSEIYRTDQDGSIEITSQLDELILSRYRDKRRQRWHRSNRVNKEKSSQYPDD
jgi:competence protein ComEC